MRVRNARGPYGKLCPGRKITVQAIGHGLNREHRAQHRIKRAEAHSDINAQAGFVCQSTQDLKKGP